MSYESAPACQMLASSCAVCGRPLLDAKSVEVGMGPDCRKKHGYNLECSEETRAHANRLVYRIALARSDASWLDANGDGNRLSAFIAKEVQELRDIGFTQLADVITKRCVAIRIEARPDGRLNVFTPYRDGIGDAFRSVPGRTWDREAKVNHIPNAPEARRALMSLLSSWFPGEGALGPKGPFQVPA